MCLSDRPSDCCSLSDVSATWRSHPECPTPSAALAGWGQLGARGPMTSVSFQACVGGLRSALRRGLGPRCVSRPESGGAGLEGREERETMAEALSAWLRANVGGGGIMHAWLCPCLRVRVSLSVCESLQQMPPPFPADHLTPVASLDSSPCVWGGAVGGGVGESGWWAGVGGRGQCKRNMRDGEKDGG